MKKEQIKREILKIMELKPQDLQGRERYLYFLVFMLIVSVQFSIMWYLVVRFPSMWTLVFILAYASVIIALILAARRERGKLEQLG